MITKPKGFMAAGMACGIKHSGKPDLALLWEIVSRVYDIENDDTALRKCNAEDVQARTRNFDTIRKNYPMRREFRFTTVHLRNASRELESTIRSLGFNVQLA